jgi:cellulose 1,4-beta-cellobiosidase
MKVNLHRRALRRADRAVVAIAAMLLGLVSLLFAIGTAHAAAGCKVTYSANSWSSGFSGSLSVTNLGDPITSWKLEWDFPGNQQVTQGWSGTFSQSGEHVTVTNVSYNGSLAANASTSLGFNGSYSGTNDAPASFKLTGTTCNGTTQPSTTPTTRTPAARGT